MKRPATILIFSALALAAGCNTPSMTIRELGHPAFESVVGKETLFARPNPNQRTGLDAFTQDVEDDANHRFEISFWPTANEKKIVLEVRAAARGRLQLSTLASAAFAVTRRQALRFEAIGELPDPAHPIAISTKTEFNEKGGATLYLFFDRAAIPEGTEWLAIPTLARFKDGWISILFYETAIPTPMKLPPPPSEGAEAEKAPSSGGEPSPPTGSK